MFHSPPVRRLRFEVARALENLEGRPAYAVTAMLALATAAFVVVVVALCHPRLLLAPGWGPVLDRGHARLDAMVASYRKTPLPMEATEGLRTLREAVVFAEDRSYSRRPAFLPPLSPMGLARAVKSNLFDGVRSGGSTIPQQLAKLVLGAGSRTVAAKVRELVFATEAVRRHDRKDLFGVYLNLALSLGERDPAGGARRASLVLRRRPLHTISREDAVILACLPRGWSKLRRSRKLLVARVVGIRNGLEAAGSWDSARPSYLDDARHLDPASEVALWPGWHAFVSGGAEGVDVAAALAEGDEALQEPQERLRKGGVRTIGGLALVRPGRSGRWDQVVVTEPGMNVALLNLASGAKLALLAVSLKRLGLLGTEAVQLRPGGGIRWWWSEGTGPRDDRRAGLIQPTDALTDERLERLGPLTLTRTVAHSVNSTAMRHLTDVLPYQLYLADPDRMLGEARRLVPEAGTLATDGERRVAGNRLADLGVPLPGESLPDELSAQAAALYAIRLLAEHRRSLGLTVRRSLPEDPTSLLGNSSAESAATLAAYLGRSFYRAPGACSLTETGAALATYFREGTGKPLARRLPRGFGLAPWKTGTSPHDDSLWFGLAVCLDRRPAVLLASLRVLDRGRLPERTYASPTLAPALAAAVQGLAERGHDVVGPLPPPVEDLLSAEGSAMLVKTTGASP